jgi:hypothetical protein
MTGTMFDPWPPGFSKHIDVDRLLTEELLPKAEGHLTEPTLENEKSPWHEEHVTGAFRREGHFNSKA